VLIIDATIGAFMPDFSHVIPASHQNISPGFLEMLIRTQREELFTGLMRLSYGSGENLIFSFLEGIQQQLYRCREAAVEVIPRQTWPAELGCDCSLVGFLRLPVKAMRIMRIVHEAPVRQVEESTFTVDKLVDAAEKWAAAREPGIVHVQSEKLNRYYLVAGDSTPVIEELSVLDGDVRVSLNDASFPKTLPKVDYRVLRYVSVRDHDVWREYELRLAFSPFMRMLLNRFNELAGRVLTERLCEQVSLWAREGGWNVSLSGNGLVNRQYFENLESAKRLYSDVLRRFQEEASLAIGSRMIDGISQEILLKLDSYRRELLARNIYSLPGLSSASVGVWR
jgi:hypothetical protein